ncbi:DUF2946 family protein [Defluviicoccus vanus]|uniref:DUF2946 domain-containing protein n=1 Tax=Defluviicoccus vanus TaxID=111831 RepID=A0A7H1MY47_9PROT|nr:DUF2946 family protein [Defluviicoccus vanus]QNT68383.1 hypothetical protein HQ394_02185 [Defluviicoccus vanus]
MSARRRKVQGAISGLAVGVLILRLLLAAIPMPSPAAASELTLIPICTAAGLKWIHFDSKGPIKPAQTAAIDCPLCVAAHGFSLLVTVVALPLPSQAIGTVAPAFHRDAPVLRIAARPPPCRAPPLLSDSETEPRSL